MCVHVLDVHIHLQKWNLESCFSAKPGFMRLVVSTSSQEHFKHLLGQDGQDMCHRLRLLWIHPRHNIYVWQQRH